MQVAGTEGWIGILNHGIDAVGIDLQPIYNYKPEMTIFFIIILVSMEYFIFNIFIAISVNFFHQSLSSQRVAEGSFYTKVQLEWLEVQTHWLKHKVPYQSMSPNIKALKNLYKLVRSRKFKLFSYILILSHSIVVASKQIGMDSYHEDIIINFSICYVCLASIEIFLD